jgi:hypothetical protein
MSFACTKFIGRTPACSGTESSELALRMVHFVTGRCGIVCSNAIYAGDTEPVGLPTRLDQQLAVSAAVRAFLFSGNYRPIAANLHRVRTL